MTNEQLVKEIQEGNTDLIPALWEQVHKFICLMAKRRLMPEPLHMQHYEDDLINEGYFGLLRAVDSYKHDKDMSFVGYLALCLKSAFNEALDVRTVKGKKDPSKHAISTDTPLSSNEELTLQDMLIDPLAAEEFRNIEDADFWREVHEILEEAINNTLEGDTHTAFTVMLNYNCGVGEACKIAMLPVDQVRGRTTSAYVKLARYLNKEKRKACKAAGLFDYIHRSYRYVGVGAFRNNHFTSSTELAVMKILEAEERSKVLNWVSSNCRQNA